MIVTHVYNFEFASDSSFFPSNFSPTVSSLLFSKCHATISLKEPESTVYNLTEECELFQHWGFILLIFEASVFRQVAVT